MPQLEFGPPGTSPENRGRLHLSGTALTLDTEHFRIHYTLSGEDRTPELDENNNSHPDFVEEVARALEFSWFAEVEHFGWPAPPSDKGLGGDERYDIYLQDLYGEEEIAGFTSEDDSVLSPLDNPNSQSIEEDAAYTYIALDNDYAEYEEDPTPGVSVIKFMRSAAAHEFNHAIQYGYDRFEPHSWVWEATATWMEDEVFDSINQTRDYLYAVFKSPDSCQLAEGGDERVEDTYHWYGLWLFMRYLSERYNHDAVRQLWESIIEHDGYAAWDSLLESKGTTFEAFFRDYSVALLTRDFQEGQEYPLVRLEGEARADETFVPLNGVGQIGADYIELLGNGVLHVALDNPRLDGLIVGIRDGQSYAIPSQDGQASFNASFFEHSYLIVLNLNRPSGEANCHLAEYTLAVSLEEQPQSPFDPLPAPNFRPPRVEGLIDPQDFFGE